MWQPPHMLCLPIHVCSALSINSSAVKEKEDQIDEKTQYFTDKNLLSQNIVLLNDDDESPE